MYCSTRPYYPITRVALRVGLLKLVGNQKRTNVKQPKKDTSDALADMESRPPVTTQAGEQAYRDAIHTTSAATPG